MSFFKRITTTLAASVESTVAAMENHDAVVAASLADMRRASAKAKARLGRIAADGRRLSSKLADLKSAEARWLDRAKQYAQSDEDKALECLRRKHGCTQQIAACEQTITQHSELEARMRASIEKIDHRYRELERTRTLMRTRQSAAEALRTTTLAGTSQDFDTIDDTLERWEARITEAEMGQVEDLDGNAFEKDFLEDEERARLSLELDALKRNA